LGNELKPMRQLQITHDQSLSFPHFSTIRAETSVEHRAFPQ
jgi:hypothetical protein